jgi:hypothetical protein
MKKRQPKGALTNYNSWGTSVPTHYRDYWRYLDNVLKHNPAKRLIQNTKEREYKRTMKAMNLTKN